MSSIFTTQLVQDQWLKRIYIQQLYYCLVTNSLELKIRKVYLVTLQLHFHFLMKHLENVQIDLKVCVH